MAKASIDQFVSSRTINPVNNVSQQYYFVGLFGYVGVPSSGTTSTATIRNVGLLNVSIGSVGGGGYYIGGLVGMNYGGTISNCYVTGTVKGIEYIGGLVGANYGTIRNSYSTASVSGT